MYSIVTFLLAAMVAVNCNLLVAETEANGVYNYLGTIGIEEAERIKQMEYNLPGSVQRIVGGFDVVSAVVPYQVKKLCYKVTCKSQQG